MQRLVFGLCFVLLLIDGFDAQVIGYAAAAIGKDLALSKSQLGLLFTGGLVGSAVGAVVLGSVADRIGRKKTLLLCTAAFGILTLLKAFADSFAVLLVLQLITGIGVGGAMPNAVALISEFSPARLRSTIATLSLCGVLVGSVAGGLLSAFLIPVFGWQSVMIVGGLAAIVLLPVLALLLPESVQFLMADGKSDRALAAARRIDPAITGDTLHTGAAAEISSTPVAELFRVRPPTMTIFLWITMFSTLMTTFLLISWLPTLLIDSGMATRQAILAVTMMPIGGIVGTLLLGYLMDKSSPSFTLLGALLIFSTSIAAIGLAQGNFPMLVLVLFVVGMGSGAQMAIVALAGRLYPLAVRSTGVGVMLGWGRLGSIAGPIFASAMIAAGWPHATIYLMAAVPVLIAAGTIYLVGASAARSTVRA